MSKADWEFGYMPVPTWSPDDDGLGTDLVLALSEPSTEAEILGAIDALAPDSHAKLLVAQAPIFWWRVETGHPVARQILAATLVRAGLHVRYVASSRRPSLLVPPKLEFVELRARLAGPWAKRKGPSGVVDPDSPGRWFLRAEAGVAVDRLHFGSGAGMRLAVIDDDAAGANELDLDAEVLVHVEAAPRNTLHGATMVALAVGTRRVPGPDQRWESFRGVAPNASPRLYCIPKPGQDVVSLPLAMVRAVAEGADVVVCASYIEGTTCPMLDDALEFARNAGRGGRGTAVVFPVGRETSSPGDSVHASLSLALGDPASDPRAFAIGPSGKSGGWFFWRDRKGRGRPFANRGPALRWLTPGDDLTFPFAKKERLGHSESSGASAIAAGVILLVLAANPNLRLDELDAILTSTATRIRPDDAPAETLADRRDVDPLGCDRDGHNAKHGYGRLHAQRACFSAADPVAASLIAIGDDEAALKYLLARRSNELLRNAYSKALARWFCRALFKDATLFHAAKAIVRHVRLVAADGDRQHAHGQGALKRQVSLTLRMAQASRSVPSPRKRVASELAHIAETLEGPSIDGAWEAKVYEVLASIMVSISARTEFA